jgi:hypothetical protein
LKILSLKAVSTLTYGWKIFIYFEFYY